MGFLGCEAFEELLACFSKGYCDACSLGFCFFVCYSCEVVCLDEGIGVAEEGAVC